MARRTSRILRTIVAAAAAVLLLSSCTGLPTSGDPKQGLALGESSEVPEILLLASDPLPGASPRKIVDDFLEAAVTPTDVWAVARKFLTPELAATWRPSEGVSIDESSSSRTFVSDAEDVSDAKNGDTVEIQVGIDMVASVDGTGAYSAATGTSSLTFSVVKTEGEWRISKAPNGIVIDQSRFPQVFGDYPLQYFDEGWSRLVPDVRWLPRRESIATAVTQTLIEGAPSPWLEPAVQSAFPSDVKLARDAVFIDAELVADVALNRDAQGLDPTTLSRMRTQLQATLKAAGIHVSQVRFTIDGRTLNAGVVKVVEEPADVGSIVLKDGAFGTIVGTEITPLAGISGEVLGLPLPATAVDVSVDESHAAIRLADGKVFLAGGGNLDEVDARPGLIAPSLDPYGYTWSVPANTPGQLVAVGDDVVRHDVADAWPGASEVSAIRVSSDGARVAAIVVVGGERWVVVSAVVRDGSGMPTSLGDALQVAQLDGPANDVVWLGSDRLGILTEADGPKILTQIVGGPGTLETAPAGAASIAGAKGSSGMRVLASSGSLFARSGSAWRESTTGILLLATRAGR